MLSYPNWSRNGLLFLLFTYRNTVVGVFELRNKNEKNCALLSSILPSVIDRSHLSPSREAAS